MLGSQTLLHPYVSPTSRACACPALQCGSQQQLRRALELVAEMRSRGVQCNVHTYSALMNVCIKGAPPRPRRPPCLARALSGRAHALSAGEFGKRGREKGRNVGVLLPRPAAGNELDLALDVYRQMLAEGCTPNLVSDPAGTLLFPVWHNRQAWQTFPVCRVVSAPVGCSCSLNHVEPFSPPLAGDDEHPH